MKFTVLLLIFSVVCYAGCQDATSNCFKKKGKRTSITYEVAPFRELQVHDGLHVYISQGDEYLVTVKAGDNIIADIQVTSENGILSLTDEITCDWVRSYEPKEVYVQCPNLRVIYQHGYGNIISNETLFFDTLSIRPRTGEGGVSLMLEARYTEVVSHRNGTIKLSGKTDFLHVALLYKLPIFDGKDFIAQHVDVVHNTNNSIHVYPVQSLKGRIQKNGNVFYYHTPAQVHVETEARGKAVDQSAIVSHF